MKSVVALVVSICVPCTLALAPAGWAAPAQSSSIAIAYVPPTNPLHQPIYERLKRSSCAREAAGAAPVRFACRRR